MLREARTPKTHDWLVNYVMKKNPHSEELRLAWSADPDPVVASAGWALTTERVAKQPEGLDLATWRLVAHLVQRTASLPTPLQRRVP
jgi:3-methyladenine DNA glycosylase AlkD